MIDYVELTLTDTTLAGLKSLIRVIEDSFEVDDNSNVLHVSLSSAYSDTPARLTLRVESIDYAPDRGGVS